MKTVIPLIFLMLPGFVRSQVFPQPGQKPNTAFPVCGLQTFKQSHVPQGSNGAVDYASCHRPIDFGPFYYSFTCYVAGTLGFVITPDKADDDYDWMLFDITGHDPFDIFSQLLVVTGNWSGTFGPTGAKVGGSPQFQCGSLPELNHPTFSEMPVLKKGHQYLLLVSNFSETQTGYTLAFGGGTAVLNNPTPPDLSTAIVGCDKSIVTITLDKKVMCNSLASDGSDFALSSGPAVIRAATGMHCSEQFDLDSIQIMLSEPLPPGNYTMISQIGTDGNTLLDQCGTALATGRKIDFTVNAAQQTPMDSLASLKCAPSKLELVFSTPMQCASIAADGSDFLLTGTGSSAITGASGNCHEGQSQIITISLNAPLRVGGIYTLALKSGSDGNTILNTCAIPTSVGSSISFSLKDTVSAAFDFRVAFGCLYDTIQTKYQPANGVNRWQWNIDGEEVSAVAEPAIPDSIFGTKNLSLVVSNGFCVDTMTELVSLDNYLKATISGVNEVCPKTAVTFSNNSSGRISSWFWDFGDGTSSPDKTPPAHFFPDTWAGKIYDVKLVVQNDLGCKDTASFRILKKQSCYISIPNAFTPNGDGKNDYLYPLNANLTNNLEFKVFNRFGQLVFQTRDWTHKWDGTMNGVHNPLELIYGLFGILTASPEKNTFSMVQVY